MTEKNGIRLLNLQQTNSMIPVINELAEKKGWHVFYVTLSTGKVPYYDWLLLIAGRYLFYFKW